jgi:Zn-dependent protease with chaperone function
VLAAAGSTVFAIAAVFRNRRPMVAGRRVRLETHDGLRQLLVEVCSRVGTRMPDNVLLIPEPQFYVTQSRLGTLDGPLRGRTLALGLPLLKVLSTGELASVVSHEFAHFHGRDLPFSALTAPLYRGLETSVGSLMASQFMPGSAIGWIIRLLVLPQVQFVQAMHWYFHSLNMILSRRRELRADWIAARCFGTTAASSALRLTHAAGAAFGEAIKSLPLEDPDGFFSAWAGRWTKILSTGFDEQPAAEPESEFDSHPPLATRLAAMPFLSAAPLSSTSDLQAEFVEEERTVSRDFAPFVRRYQRLLREQARERGDSPGADDSSDASPPQPSPVKCPKCLTEVIPTFHGCCPKCDESLK